MKTTLETVLFSMNDQSPGVLGSSPYPFQADASCRSMRLELDESYSDAWCNFVNIASIQMYFSNKAHG